MIITTSIFTELINSIIGKRDAITAAAGNSVSITGAAQPGATDTVALVSGPLALGLNANVSAAILPILLSDLKI